MFSPRTLPITCAAICVLGMGAAFGQEKAPPSQVESAKSMILEFTEETSELQEALEQLILPPKNALVDALDEKLTAIAEFLPELVKNPDDVRYVARYEDLVSESLTATVVHLEEYSSVRPDVEKAIGKARAAGESKLKDLKELQEREANSAAMQATQAKAIEDKLRQLAKQAKPLLESQGEVPLAVDRGIRNLDQELKILNRNASISQEIAAIASEEVAVVDSYLAALDVQEYALERAFVGLDGTLASLTNVARLRERNLAAGKARAEMLAIGQRMQEMSTSLSRIGGIGQNLLDTATLHRTKLDTITLPVTNSAPLKSIVDSYTKPTPQLASGK
ncbi:MAG: hypothetical protein KDA90_20875 [Planctomycetaceae bacterium]|nr:hypothetical protein [Planctomycetaceae bacterium]